MTKQQEEARLRQVNCRLIGESCTCNPDVLELPCFGCVKAYVDSADLTVKTMRDHVKDFYDQRAASKTTGTASTERMVNRLHEGFSLGRLMALRNP